MLTSILLLTLSTTIFFTTIANSQACRDKYSSCNPPGATATSAPTVGGGDLSSLYVDLLGSIGGVHKTRHLDRFDGLLEIRDAVGGVCCADGTQCLLVQTYNLPFCYDKFTTNYFLPGGSFGQIVSGTFNASDGSTANLLTGDYKLANGTIGNVYGSSSSPSKPNTSTLTLPTQYTGAGVGSAIPIGSLGELETYTTTIPATTIPATTESAMTATESMASGSTGNTLSTIPATTVPATTRAAMTSTVTTKIADTSSASVLSTANTASTSKAAAPLSNPRDSIVSAGATGFGFLLFALLGL